MNRKKLLGIGAALITFIVVGLLAVQGMYYLKGYPPATNMLKHQLLASVGFLIGIIVSSFVYNYIQGDNTSSWLHKEEKK